MKRLLLCTALVCAAPAAYGQADDTLLVRAAEHPSYSRLVVPIEPGMGWSLSQDGKVATLRVSGLARYDASEVFRRMARTRILAVKSYAGEGESQLVLTLGCDCDVESEQIGSRFLALDVRQRSGEDERPGPRTASVEPEADSGLPPAGRSGGASRDGQETDRAPAALDSENVGAAPRPADGTVSARAMGDAAGADTGAISPPFPGSRPGSGPAASVDPSPAPALDVDLSIPASRDPSGTAPPPVSRATLSANSVVAARPLDDGSVEQLGSVRASLLDQLDRAASEGLLELDPDARRPDTAAQDHDGTDHAGTSDHASSTPERQDQAAEQVALRPATGPDPELPWAVGGQVAVRSSLDRRAPKRPEPGTMGTCVVDDQLSFETWVKDEPFARQLGNLRRALVDERQRPNPDAVADLARFYLGMGFGAEAASVLKSFELPGADAAVLADLARVIDGLPVDPEGPLAQSEGCGGRVALWRAAAGLLPEEMEGNTRIEMRNALSSLPAEVRMIIGGRVSVELIDSGSLDPASDLLDILERSAAQPAPETRLAEAKLLAEIGREEEAEAAFIAIQEENTSVSHEALLTRVRRELGRGQRVSDQDEADLAIEARRLVGTDASAEFTLLLAEVRAQRGNLEEALEMIARVARELPAEAGGARQLGSRLLAAARPEETGLATYARAVVRHGDMLGQDRSATRQRIDIAATLNDVGLPNLALDLLADSRSLPETGFLTTKARALLASNKPDEALDALAGLRTAEAERLRADAMARIGAYDEAVAVLRETGTQSERLPGYALLARDWATLDRSGGDSALAELGSRFVAAPDDPLNAQALSLANLQGALDRSRKLRDLIDRVGSELATE